MNMHELAVTSGFSAAYRLGAKYPFSGDRGCERLFKLYLAASHGMRAVSGDLTFFPRSTPMADARSERKIGEGSLYKLPLNDTVSAVLPANRETGWQHSNQAQSQVYAYDV